MHQYSMLSKVLGSWVVVHNSNVALDWDVFYLCSRTCSINFTIGALCLNVSVNVC